MKLIDPESLILALRESDSYTAEDVERIVRSQPSVLELKPRALRVMYSSAVLDIYDIKGGDVLVFCRSEPFQAYAENK